MIRAESTLQVADNSGARVRSRASAYRRLAAQARVGRRHDRRVGQGGDPERAGEEGRGAPRRGRPGTSRRAEVARDGSYIKLRRERRGAPRQPEGAGRPPHLRAGRARAARPALHEDRVPGAGSALDDAPAARALRARSSAEALRRVRLGKKNVHQVPRPGEGRRERRSRRGHPEPEAARAGVEELSQITGQKAVRKRAQESVANFKLRQGQAIGAMVTLRGSRCWEFLDRLMNVALPRVRDFKGVSSKSFDGPRQLHAGCPRADHLRDRLRQGRAHHGAQHHGRDHGQRMPRARRCSPTSACPSARTREARNEPMMTDPVGDMLTRIRNAGQAKHKQTRVRRRS